MRILNLLPSAYYGGPEKQILLTAVNLRARYGHEFAFLIMSPPGKTFDDNEFVRLVRAEGFPVREFQASFRYNFLWAARRLRRDVRESRYELLLTYGYKADIVATLLPRRMKKIAVLHGWTGADRKVRFFEVLDRAVLRFFPKLVVISRAQVELLANLGFPAAKVVSIPNALDLERLPAPIGKAELRRSLSIAEGSRVIGSVGRLSFEKGHADLLLAFRLVYDRAPDVHLVLVGDGPEEGKLKALARELRIDSRVRFAGFQRDGGTWIGGMDLFVLPSHREALPLVLLEAFAYRTPVLGTRVGDVKLLIRDGETGWCVDPGKPEDLANRISATLEDPDKAREVARRAHKLLTLECSPTRQAELWQKVLAGF